MKVNFFKHNIEKTDINRAVSILKSIFLTTGQEVYELEKALAQYTNNKFAVGVNSCTNALFIVLKYFNITKGDEVITTPLSFIATANVIEYCGAKPVFVDVEPETGNINAELIEEKITSKTKAIIVVHLYGQLVDMKKINKLAKKYNLKVIEDAAHCLEGSRDGITVGQLSDAACYSFYATKNITSGEGGAITTNDKNMYDWLKSAVSHGMSKNAADRYTKEYQHYDMNFLGYKFNLTNISAALLINQLKRIEKLLKKREKLAQYYDKLLFSNQNIQTPKVLNNTKHSRHLYTIWVDPAKRDWYLSELGKHGVGVAVNFRPIHLMRYYVHKYGYKTGAFPIAEKIGSSTLTLPLYPKLTMTEVKYICKTINTLSSE